jgi:hypothetical protein
LEAAVLYLTGSVTGGVREHLDKRRIGMMNTPNIGNRLDDSWLWAADNGCYGSGYVGDRKWLAWLESFNDKQREHCLFAAAPDVVGDAQATIARSLPLLPSIRALGFPAAFVAQDGLTVGETPWEDADAIFIGGSTTWKLGPEAKVIITEAKMRGKHIHVGRVNSQRRFLAFAALGCDTADGTYLAFGPRINLPTLLGWIRHHETQRPLFGVEVESVQ